MIPQHILNVPVTVKYQINIDALVSKRNMQYTTVNPTAANYKLTESSHPELVSLSTGAIIMLLRNYFVEQFPKNGSFSFVQNMFYH